MKRKITRFLLCTLLSSLLLSVSALADSGPKPQLIVRVEHAPQELYYLDLLAEGEYDATIKISTYSLTDQSAMNGANVETVLIAK